MKKIFLTLCVLAGIISLNSCGANRGMGLNENAQLCTVSEQWKKDAVKEVAGKLNELVGDSKYVEVMASREYAEYCDILKETKIDETKDADVYTVDEDYFEDILETEGIAIEDFSDAGREIIADSALSSVGSQLVSRFGVKSLSLYSMFQANKTYAIDKPFDNQIWIIPTDNESAYILASVTSSDELYPLCSISCRYIYADNSENVYDSLTENMALLNLECEKIEIN